MSNASSNPSRSVTPADVLAVYAEPLVVDRRVALVGAGDEPLVETILQLGARILYVYDPRPDVAPARGLSDGRVSVLSLRAGDIGVRDGAFDVAIVPDLSVLGDREEALGLVRRLVGTNGVALVASRNPEAAGAWLPAPEGGTPPSYNDLYDVCALQFSEVRMIGAAPFAGYAVAEFAPEGEPAIAFDASLVLEPDAPEWFVAVVSQRAPASRSDALEAFEVVQVPTSDVHAGRTGDAAPGVRAQLAATEQKLREAEARAGDQSLRAERLTNDLRASSDEARKLREKLAKIDKVEKSDKEVERAEPLRARIAELEKELIEARTALATPRTSSDEIQRLQLDRERMAQETTQLRDRVAVADRIVQPLRNEVEVLQRKLVDRERELEASLSRAQRLEDRLEEQLVESTSRAADEGVMRASREEAARSQAELASLQQTHQEDVGVLEGALRARGEELRAARQELAHRERLVRELVGQLEEAQSMSAGATGVVVQRIETAGDDRTRVELERAHAELALLVEEVRRRDAALTEIRPLAEVAARELEAERGKNAELARDAAKREAELQTAAWRIAELEQNAGSRAPNGGGGGGDDARRKLESELDALRRALAQEHEKTEQLQRRIESMAGGSGDDLQRALERLSEREALIAQLSAEIAAMRTAGAG
jgi:hypothetical protein